MHYKQAEEAFAKNEDNLTFKQEIEVVNRPDALYVRHHFHNLSERRQEIVWPAMSVNRSCHLADATSCDRLDENATAFLEGENERQSISYEIPKDGPTEKNALFHEPFATLHEVTVESTWMHITDETGASGMWVNGLEQVGHKKMDHIEYALYRGVGEVQDLYWQQQELPLAYEGKKVAVYGEGLSTDRLKEIDNALQKMDAVHSTIVIDKGNPAVSTARFIVSGNPDVDKVSDRILTNNVLTRFSMSRQQQGTAEVIASILSEKAVGTENSRRIYEAFLDTLTGEETEQLRNLLIDREGQAMDAAHLDELVGEVTGLKTSFFARSIQDDSVQHPFLFEDSRKVLLEGEALPDVRIILKDGKTFYPAKKLLSVAGYDVTSNERSIYIENELRQFRFPKKELFYVYNDRRFDVITMPFEIMDGDFYFEESWFKRLFLFSVDKTGEEIRIMQLST